MWSRYVQPHLGKIALANLRTVQVTALLAHYANNGLNRNSLTHVKLLLSGIYRYVIKTGVLPTGKNPVTVNIKGEGAGWTVSVALRQDVELLELQQGTASGGAGLRG